MLEIDIANNYIYVYELIFAHTAVLSVALKLSSVKPTHIDLTSLRFLIPFYAVYM